MNRIITLLLAVAFTPSFAQEIYQPFAVEREAAPKGGTAWLEKFIEVNRRMPYSAEVQKIKGGTFVSGVVEPDGSVSDLRITRSLNPACDREAVRVLDLFKAWQPALKDGKPVRQQFTYAVKFSPQLTGAEPDKIVTYYDKQRQPVADEAQAELRMITPVDSLGYPVASSIVSERRSKGWKELEKYLFLEQNKQIHNFDERTGSDSIPVQRRNILFAGRFQGAQYTFYKNGLLQAVEHYRDGQLFGKATYYYQNGLVKREEEQVGPGQTRIWSWYPNGQIKQVMIKHDPQGDALPGLFELLHQWDSLGNQLVKDGQGLARLESRETEGGWLIEEGRVVDGKKDSIWVGQVDGRSVYRETYTNGLFLGGVSFTTTGDSTVYKLRDQIPQFKGGSKAMYQFLGENMRYPIEAARNRIQGRVIVSFVVCTDGTLCDYEASGSEDGSLRREAVRVVKAMSGKWTPGIQRGRPVRVKFNMPITFAQQ